MLMLMLMQSQSQRNILKLSVNICINRISFGLPYAVYLKTALNNVYRSNICIYDQETY